STDAARPVSAITYPLGGASLPAGSPITVSGTAADLGGGVVAAVEVSTNGGALWHPALGRGSWTYTWTPSSIGSITILSRASDDSANLENPSAGAAIAVVNPVPALSFL